MSMASCCMCPGEAVFRWVVISNLLGGTSSEQPCTRRTHLPRFSSLCLTSDWLCAPTSGAVSGEPAAQVCDGYSGSCSWVLPVRHRSCHCPRDFLLGLKSQGCNIRLTPDKSYPKRQGTNRRVSSSGVWPVQTGIGYSHACS